MRKDLTDFRTTADIDVGPSSSDPDDVVPEQLAAFPTLRRAATIIGITASSLSRRGGLPTEQRGREKRVRPSVVMELARYYRKRSEYEVAADLVDYAVENAPEFVDLVEREIDGFFAGTGSAVIDPSLFLREAQRALPPELFELIEAAYRENAGRRLGGSVSATRDD